MEINLEINNVTKSPVKKGFFEAVVEKTFTELNLNFLKDKKINISLALIAPEETRKLNKEYRQHDNVTDILSFSEYRNIKEITAAVLKKPHGELFLGELILCYNDIKEYADKKDLDLRGELAKIITHGVLHLLGFSHGKKMFKIQNRIGNDLIKAK